MRLRPLGQLSIKRGDYSNLKILLSTREISQILKDSYQDEKSDPTTSATARPRTIMLFTRYGLRGAVVPDLSAFLAQGTHALMLPACLNLNALGHK